VVAGLTPETWDVRIIDEAVEPVDLDLEADLVGLTAMTPLAPRAYLLADHFRRRGLPVVLGGMHPTVLPEEAGHHADAVVVGEAEGVWSDVLKDAVRRRFRPIYRSVGRPSLVGLPQPRRDLFRPEAYLATAMVQTSRGCPFSCDFCSVSRFFGRTYRWRPVEDVIREVAGLGQRVALFVDDNILGAPARAKELFQRLIPLKINWIGQSSVNIARNAELLRLAAKSGCKGLFIGLESLTAGNLRQMGKNLVNRVGDYREAIARIQGHGIGVEGAFIFGLDQDDPDVFRRTVDFARRTRLAAAQFGILTPFPGTALRERLERERRITDRDWGRYTISQVTYQPARMSATALKHGCDWAYRAFYSYPSILGRLVPQVSRFRSAWPLFMNLNLHFREIAVRRRGEEGAKRRDPGDGLGLSPA
jgi:radical SAM superfamily enzyme YgiQ (UPF0313 family)